ncbi:MAG TPA: hypothetical protein VGI19_15805, partial [Candidatus Cybelea sp.]
TNLGSPISTTPEAGTTDPVNFVFGPGRHQFLTADVSANDVDIFAYPAGGAALKTITIAGSSGPIGEAIVPIRNFVLHH